MSKRNKIIIIALIVIIGLVLAWLLYDRLTAPPSQLIENQQDLGANLPAGQNNLGNQPANIKFPPGPIKNFSPVEQSLYNVARNFAERYGTFSTDSGFANLEEVKLFSSAKMISQIDQLIKNSQQSAEFYGVTSKVLNVEIKEANDQSGSGQAVVSLQRQETKSNLAPFVYYQNLQLALIKSGNNWLVDEVKWLDK
jgi:hypothetical protein